MTDKDDRIPQEEIIAVKAITEAAVAMAYGTVQAGFPSPAESYRDKSLDFNEYLIENEAATFVLRARGDSMIEAGIHDGDLLVVDRSRPAHKGSIVVMRINNEYTVKRYCVSNTGEIYLHAENESGTYPDIHCCEGDEWELFGVVTHTIQDLVRTHHVPAY